MNGRSISELAQFIWRHYSPAQKWDHDILLSWVDWHASQGFISLALDDDHSICGLAIARPVMKPQDGEDFYATDPEGSCIFVDLVIALRPLALNALVLAALKRFGMRDFIAWKRAPYYIIEFHDAHKFRRVILRKETAYGQF